MVLNVITISIVNRDCRPASTVTERATQCPGIQALRGLGLRRLNRRPSAPGMRDRASWAVDCQRCVFDPKRLEYLIEDDRSERPEADPRQCKISNVDGVIGGTHDQRHRRNEEIAALREIDPILDPDANAGHRDEPKQDRCNATQHRRRDRSDERTELGTESENDRGHRRDDEDGRREHLRDRHDTDVLGIGRHAGSTTETRDRRRQSIPDEATSEERHQISTRHLRDGLDMTGILGDEDDRHRRDKRDRVPVERWTSEVRPPYPCRIPDRLKIDSRDMHGADRTTGGVGATEKDRDQIPDQRPQQDRKAT